MSCRRGECSGEGPGGAAVRKGPVPVELAQARGQNGLASARKTTPAPRYMTCRRPDSASASGGRPAPDPFCYAAAHCRAGCSGQRSPATHQRAARHAPRPRPPTGRTRAPRMHKRSPESPHSRLPHRRPSSLQPTHSGTAPTIPAAWLSTATDTVDRRGRALLQTAANLKRTHSPTCWRCTGGARRSCGRAGRRHRQLCYRQQPAP